MNLTAENESDLKQIATEWLRLNPQPCICLITGDMGAGKTTFVKSICKELQISEPITSPTFSLVNEYKSSNGQTIFHFDLYRLESEDELYDFGFEEYLSANSYVFIEWPELGSNFYSGNISKINISIVDEKRFFEFS